MNIKQALALCTENVFALRANSTALAYVSSFKLFLELLQDNEIEETDSLEEVTMNHFIRFSSWLATKEYSKKTIGVYSSGIKFFLDWMVIEDYIRPTYNETLRYKKARNLVNRKREDHLIRFPEPNDVDKMLNAVRLLKYEPPIAERNIAIVEFLASTGARNNELCQLKINDIDNKVETAVVMGKGEKERRVFICQTASESLLRYWKTRGGFDSNEFAFIRHDRGVGKNKKPITTTTIRTIIKEVSMMAGIDTFTPHYFRHAFAIRMLSETGNLALVQDLLGHSSPVATRVYAKIYPKDLQKAHAKVYN